MCFYLDFLERRILGFESHRAVTLMKKLRLFSQKFREERQTGSATAVYSTHRRSRKETLKISNKIYTRQIS